MTRTARVLGTALVLVIGIGLPLLGIELALRVAGSVPMVPQMFVLDDRLGHRLKPGVEEHARVRGVYDYRWTVDERGFRGPTRLAAAGGARRVLMIGDSFTFGIGVNDEETYAARLDALLDSACPAGGVEVVNAGVGGYGTSQALAMLERTRSSLRPELIVYGFYVNDPTDDVAGGVYRLEGDSLVARPPAVAQASTAKRITEAIPGYSWLIRHSAIVNWMRMQYFAARTPVGPDAGTATPEVTPSWELTTRLLARMQEQAEASGASLLMVLIPDSISMRRFAAGDTTSAEGGAQVLARALQACATAGLECVDLRPAVTAGLAGRDPAQLYIANEGHWNAAGHEMAARVLAPRMAARLGCGASKAVVAQRGDAIGTPPER